jgi:long-chain acyl-CoA synthetase
VARAQHSDDQLPPLDVHAALKGKDLVVVGATGFLGKVWLSLLLHRYPDVGHLYLMVRGKKDLDHETRFWTEVVPSQVFDPVRDQHPGAAFEQFMRDKITPVSGDVCEPLLGLSHEVLEKMKGSVAAVVNVAGVVDFNPPLDEALKVNAFGAQNLIELSRHLGGVPVMHTSTCYVVGRRDGLIEDHNPLDFPFPRADELDRSHWDADREIAECIDIVEQTRRRAEDAPRQSHLLDEAKRNLKAKGEPMRGKALEDELEKVKRRFAKDRLIDAGVERAQFWGWPNIYTYTKSIGEQVFLRSEVRTTLVRPAIVESALEFPVPGWCEGINTSSPIMYLAMKGVQYIPAGDHCYYDAVPVDLVSAGMIAALAALLEDRHSDVYQLCTSDVNPLRTRRAGELIGLSKRQRYREATDGNALANTIQSYTEPAVVHVDTWRRLGAPMVKKTSKSLSKVLELAKGTPLAAVTEPVRRTMDAVHKQSTTVTAVMDAFVPFITQFEYRFSAKNTRKLMANLAPADSQRLPWNPEEIDWRHYWLDVHTKGFEKWAEPLLEERIKRETKALRRHDDLVSMLEDMAERHEYSMAFQRLEGEQLTRISYGDVLARSAATAARLWAAGVRPGDRVALSAKNHPDWPIAYFGIVRTGAAAVPMDPDYEVRPLSNVLRASGAKIAIFGDEVERPDSAIAPDVDVWNLHEATAPDTSLEAPEVEIRDDMLASVIYTSGTTGDPKGVMLTHENFTALVAALAPLFPLKSRDRVLSVLPLHHTFEFTCGMLLPLSRGARVIYLDEVAGDRLVKALELGQVTAMVGVPALWQLLERKILSNVRESGPIAEKLFELLLDINRNMGRNLGFDLGHLLFGPVHRALGGNLRTLISGGSALPEDVQHTFAGLGLHLAEGYGLTEAAPVLTVAKAGPRNKGGNVGKAIPGVEVKIADPNDQGVGEVLARGPNVMKGYADNPEATAQVLEDGWLRTGDLGRIDDKDRLHIVGRSKEVIVTHAGENVYPDDVETTLGTPEHIDELSILGVPDPRGNERVACLAVPSKSGEPEDDETLDKKALHARALRSLKKAFDDLPAVQRPTIVHLTDTELPRTATRKVKRREVRERIERLEAAKQAVKEVARSQPNEVIRKAVAAVAKLDPSEIRLEQDIIDDLGFDSLMVVELTAALETALPRLPAERLAECRTIGQIEELARESGNLERSRTSQIEKDEDDRLEIPDVVRDVALPVLTEGQRRFYADLMKVDVKGRANIPQNRNTLIVANHASHLDMGLVKYALGNYGAEMVALAAEDYFFEGKYKRAYFENFTYMAPLDRRSGLRKTLRQAGEQLSRGRTVLIFPEGTRSPDGIIRDFMPLIGHLAMNHDVDILPVYLGGTHKAFPKGSKIPIPRRRKVSARIGPVLTIEQMRARTEGMKRADAYREIARLCQQAVEALRDGRQIDFSRELPAEEGTEQGASRPGANGKSAMAELFADLGSRFVPNAVDGPVSFYFSLGEAADGKWTIQVKGESCDIAPGRPQGGKADCVLKTSPEIFNKIVRESYTPSVAEFMSGKVKSNDIQLLQTFQKIFDL